MEWKGEKRRSRKEKGLEKRKGRIGKVRGGKGKSGNPNRDERMKAK